MGLQARRGQAVVEDLRGGRLLEQELAALAGPLAADLPLHEELRRNDVQPLADVLAHALHRLAAFARGVLGFDAMVHAWQMIGQRLALGAALVSWLVRLWGRARGLLRGLLQRRKLRLQAGLVGGQGLGEQLPLLGGHPLGLGAELPGLQPGELEGDLLDLRVPPLDRLLR